MGLAEASASIISLGGLLFFACAPAGPAEPAPSATPAKSAGCPNLENRLYQLVASPNPTAFAEQNGITYANGAVRVVIEMRSRGETIPPGYSAKEETRSNELIQAMVSLDELCRLSNEASVKAIRAPFRAVPLKR